MINYFKQEDPFLLYKQENEHLRRKYYEELQKHQTKQNNQNQKDQKDFDEFWQNFEKDTLKKFKNYQQLKQIDRLMNLVYNGMPIAMLILILYILFEYSVIVMDNKSDVQKNLEQDQIDSLRQKSILDREEKKNQYIYDFQQSQKNMKKFLIDEKYTASDYLVDYTIYPDIKFYQTHFEHFFDENEPPIDEKVKQIQSIRINTLLTLSLEAERLLQNTFISVNQLKKIIEKDGYYKPPVIYHRYYGFIKIKLRKMPVIWENITKSQEHISLYDLFFNYYSPIPMVFDKHFNISLQHSRFIPDTTTRESVSWIGDIHLNDRQIQKKYLKGDEKHIYFWRGNSQVNQQQNKRYISAWDNYYK